MKGLTKSQKALRKKWIKALRSGRFEQKAEELEGVISDDDGHSTGRLGHCCLGVLCRLVSPEGSLAKFKADPQYNGGPLLEILNPQTRALVGITADDQDALTDLNDSGVSFVEIAALLENLPAPE